ncbi:MAG: hypothetical protein KGJ60_11805, partial [Verrucomicrobiota bacterium]|nr:hypothetical protein [Verrucomicrobiota bacterium]
MSAETQSPFAWEPLTPRGVAAFAHARLRWLWLVQVIVAVLVAAATDWFLSDSCFPVIGEAIGRLPAQGEIRSGRLDWRGPSPRLLAESGLLGLVVDLDHSGQIHSTSQVQIEFGRQTVRVFWLPGYAEFHYPTGWIIAFNQTVLEPGWAAWAPEILALAAVAVLLGLWIAWTVLA